MFSLLFFTRGTGIKPQVMVVNTAGYFLHGVIASGTLDLIAQRHLHAVRLFGMEPVEFLQLTVSHIVDFAADVEVADTRGVFIRIAGVHARKKGTFFVLGDQRIICHSNFSFLIHDSFRTDTVRRGYIRT